MRLPRGRLPDGGTQEKAAKRRVWVSVRAKALVQAHETEERDSRAGGRVRGSKRVRVRECVSVGRSVGRCAITCDTCDCFLLRRNIPPTIFDSQRNCRERCTAGYARPHPPTPGAEVNRLPAAGDHYPSQAIVRARSPLLSPLSPSRLPGESLLRAAAVTPTGCPRPATSSPLPPFLLLRGTLSEKGRVGRDLAFSHPIVAVPHSRHARADTLLAGTDAGRRPPPRPRAHAHTLPHQQQATQPSSSTTTTPPRFHPLRSSPASSTAPCACDCEPWRCNSSRSSSSGTRPSPVHQGRHRTSSTAAAPHPRPPLQRLLPALRPLTRP